MSNPGLTNIKCWWKLDEISGYRYDEMGNVGLAQVGGVGSASGTHAFMGLAAEFNAGNSEYLWSSTSGPHLQGGQFPISIGFWMQPHIIATNSDILSRWGATSGAQEYLIHTVSSIPRFTIRDSNLYSYFVQASSFGALTNGVWYFVGVYFDSVTNKIGIGINDVWRTQAISTYGINAATLNFYLGYRDDISTYYDGLLDETFFYSNRLLNSAEWTWLYNSGYGRRYQDVAQLAPPSIDVVTTVKMPEIYVYDEDLNAVGVIDEYSSLNWAERYNSEGDFELELPLSWADSSLLAFGHFLYISTSDKLMVIEEKKPTRGPTEGSLLVNGRSAESILRRRELMTFNTFIDTPVEYIIYSRVYWSVVFGAGDADRIIDLFEDDLDIWPPAMSYVITASDQYETESIYEVIEGVAKMVSLGFKIIVPDLASLSSKLYFLVYEGVDRSSGQTDNDWVTFSETFDNLLNSSFLTTEKDKVNLTVVFTDDAVHSKVFVWEGGSSENPGGTEPTGLTRFEGRLDTTINRDTDDDDIDDLTDGEVLAIIEERGRILIKENALLAIFDGDVDARTQFILEEDFFLGDIVQVNAHGINDSARVIEVVKSYSVEGEKIYIAFDFDI